MTLGDAVNSKRLLVSGGPILTLDSLAPRPEAMVVENGRVLALGERRMLEAHLVGGASRLDLAGRALVPGFTDSHLHLLSYGLMLDQVQLAGVSSLAEMAALLREGLGRLPEDAWVVGRGWDQDRLAERRYPTRQDLDAAVGSRPTLLTRACGHCSVANSRALAIAGITEATSDPAGGLIERDPATGEPTGVLHETAAHLVRRAMPRLSPEMMHRGLQRALELALSKGLVACHPDDVRTGGDFATVWDLYAQLLPELGGPRIRMDVSDFQLDALVERGLRSGSGDARLSVGAIKTFVDGSLGARSAALTRPYNDGPGAGILVQERGDFLRTVREAHRHALQVAVHAIGDLAIDWALDAIEAAQTELPGQYLRHRVVHAQITRPDQLPRFWSQDVVADIQPKFVTTDKLWVEERVGRERAQHSYCWASMIRSGVACAGGSDGPVEPLDPLLGVFAAVTRQGLDCEPVEGWLPGERLTLLEALRLFACGGAYAAGSEAWRGSLTPGHAADFVVLDRCPEHVDPREIKDLQVLATYIDGRQVYAI